MKQPPHQRTFTQADFTRDQYKTFARQNALLYLDKLIPELLGKKSMSPRQALAETGGALNPELSRRQI